MTSPDALFEDIQAIREQSPLVHNITNYVVMRLTADALLALGASPIMAHAGEEMEEMAGLASSLVINIGTLSLPWITSMHKALRIARQKGKPVLLDPVGAGATRLRTKTALDLIEAGPPDIIRGNASEIAILAREGTEGAEKAKPKGVDAVLTSDQVLEDASKLARQTKRVVVVTGKSDYIITREKTARLDGGHAMMARVTGIGCTLTALMGAFVAIQPDPFTAALHATALNGIVGEMAAEQSAGPGSFRTHFLDTLYSICPEDIKARFSHALL